MHNAYNTQSQRTTPTTLQSRRITNASVYQYQPTEYTTTTNAAWLNTSVSNWHNLAEQLRQQCDDKSEELKQLVGRQYKTLIGTADKVDEMQTLVDSIHACIDQFNSLYYDIQAHCKHAAQPYDDTATPQQYNILAEIDTHLHTIQRVRTHIDNNEYTTAIEQYIAAATQNQQLLQQLHSQDKADALQPTREQLLPLLQRFGNTVQQFPSIAQHRATQCLHQSLSLNVHSDAIAALILLHTNKQNAVEAVLQQYLTIQQQHIAHTVWSAATVLNKCHNKHNAAERIVSDVYKRAALHIIHTLNAVRTLFSSQPTADANQYDQCNIAQQLVKFAARHKVSAAIDLPADRLTMLVKQWFTALTTALTAPHSEQGLPKLLQHATSIHTLCSIRDTLFDALNYTDNDAADDTNSAKQRQQQSMQLDDSVRVLFAATLTSPINVNTLFDNLLYAPLLQHGVTAVDAHFKHFSIVSCIDTELSKSHSATVDTAIDLTAFIAQCTDQLQTLNHSINQLTTFRYSCTCQHNKAQCIYHNDRAANTRYIRFTYYERFVADTLQPHIQRQYTAAVQSIADTLKQRLTALEFKLLDTTASADVEAIVRQCLLIGRICYALTDVQFVHNSSIVLNVQHINSRFVALGKNAVGVWSKHIAALITKQYTTHIQHVTYATFDTTVMQPSSYVLQILFSVIQHLYNAQSDSVNNDIVAVLTQDVTTSLLAVYDTYDTASQQRCIDLTTLYTMLPLQRDSTEQQQLLNNLITKCNVAGIRTLSDAQQQYSEMLQQLILRHKLLFGSLLHNVTPKSLLSAATPKHKANNSTDNSVQTINLLQLAPSVGRIPGISVSLYPLKAGHTSAVSAAKHRTSASISATAQRPRVQPVRNNNTVTNASQSAEYLANYGLGLLSKYTGTQQYSATDASLKAQQVLDRGQILGKSLLGKFINTDK